MRTVYVELNFGCKSFDTGKIAIIAIQTEKDEEYITAYAEFAKEKVCEELGLNKDEITIFGWSFLGENVMFI